VRALESNTTGGSNTADGVGALILNRTGSNNTATGEFALFENDASQNTADGQNALRHNTTGNNNTAIGQASLSHNTTGSNNTGIGQNALRFNKTGSFNIGLGVNAGSELTTGDNNIDIANKGVAGEENTIRIGKAETQTATFIAGISGATVPDGVGVIIDTSGHLGTVVSSARFKDGIKPMDKASESVLALKPVTFRYKHELDPEGIPQFGLVAEQVEKVNPDLVVRDAKGEAYTVRYEAVNAMLLNEFLKEHRTVQELKSTVASQEATIAQLKEDFRATVARLSERLEEQASQIQKVSAQLEVSKPMPQVVLNNQR